METADNLSLRVASFSCYLDTAKDNLVHRVSAQETSTIKPPPFSIKFSKPKEVSQDHNSLTNLRVDSFNSYLNTAVGDHNFVFEVPGPIQDPTSAFTFSQEIPKDGEIGVFGADRYFNMKLEYKTTEAKTKVPENLPRVGSNIRPRSIQSLSSEASSWNSQTALLPNLQRLGSQTKQKRTSGRRIFAGFGCRGPCFDKKSVPINEIVPYTSKPTRVGSERIDHLALVPVPNPGTDQYLTAKKQMTIKVEALDESRNSIEVFGSRMVTAKGDVATNMERKLSMLTWDAIPKGPTLPTSSSTVCDDMASEASSDLFEIENISGSFYPLLTSELPADHDNMSSCMSPTSHYAPSEASIQWSVVTASAADYNSMLLDYNNDDMSVSVAGDVISRTNVSNRITKTKIQGGKEVPKSRPGGLLGCKSHKAVDVVVAAQNICHKTAEKVKNQGLDLSVSFGKSGRVKDIDTLNMPRAFANGGLSP